MPRRASPGGHRTELEGAAGALRFDLPPLLLLPRRRRGPWSVAGARLGDQEGARGGAGYLFRLPVALLLRLLFISAQRAVSARAEKRAAGGSSRQHFGLPSGKVWVYRRRALRALTTPPFPSQGRRGSR